MGLFSAVSAKYDAWATNQNAKFQSSHLGGGNTPQVSMDTNQAGATNMAREIQGFVGSKILSLNPTVRTAMLYYNIMVLELERKMQDKINTGIEYDAYTESIIGEAIAYQPPDVADGWPSKKPSQKNTKYSYSPKRAGFCKKGFQYDRKSRLCVKK